MTRYDVLDLLIEASCPKKLPKGPPSSFAEVKDGSPTVLKRRFASIITKRKGLDKAVERLQKSQDKLKSASGKKKDAAEVDVVCDEARLEIAKKHVEFSMENWKRHVDWAGKHGKQTQELQDVIAFGDSIYAGGEKHVSVAGTNEAAPEMPDIKVNKKGALVTASGEAFDIPSPDPTAGTGAAAIVEPPAPVPAVKVLPEPAPGEPAPDEPPSVPDEAGFISEIVSVLTPFIKTVADANAASTFAQIHYGLMMIGKPIVSLMSTFHIPELTDALKGQVVDAIAEVIKAAVDQEAVKKQLFDYWHALTDSEEPTPGKFVPIARKEPWAPSLAVAAIVSGGSGLKWWATTYHEWKDDYDKNEKTTAAADLEAAIPGAIDKATKLADEMAANNEVPALWAVATKVAFSGEHGHLGEMGKLALNKHIEKALGKKWNVALTADQGASAGAMALDLVKGVAEKGTDPSTNMIGLIHNLRVQIFKATGVVATVATSKGIVESAIEKFEGMPKPFDSLSLEHQQEIKGAAKYLAITYALSGDDTHNIAMGLHSLGVTASGISGVVLSNSAIGALYSDAIATHCNKSWGSLDQATKDTLVDAVLAAPSGESSLKQVLKGAGIVALSTKGLEDFAAAIVEAKPEEPDLTGFWAAITAVVKGVPVEKASALLKYAGAGDTLLSYINAQPAALVDLAAKYHIKHLEDDFEETVMALAKDQVKALFPLEEMKADLFKEWDSIAKDINPGAFGGPVKTAGWSNVSSKLPVGIPSHLLDGGHDFNVWLQNVYTMWYAKWAKEQEEATTPPAPPSSTSSSTPPATTTTVIPGLPDTSLISYSPYKKIFKPSHLNVHQKKYLVAMADYAVATGQHLTKAGKVKKSLGGVAKTIQTQFKADYAHAGVTGLGIGLVKNMLMDAVAHPPKPASAATTAPTPTAPAAAPGDYLAMAAAIPASMVGNGPGKAISSSNLQQFKSMAADIFIEKKWAADPWVVDGVYHSHEQKNTFLNLLTQVQSAISPDLGAAPAVALPGGGNNGYAGAPEIAHDTAAADNPIGMGYEELKAYAKVERGPLEPKAPSLNSSGWIDKGQAKIGGAHPKLLYGTDADYHAIPFAESSHGWMTKKDESIPGTIYGEVAAGKVQNLLGLGVTKVVYADKNPDGHPIVMQHFKKQPDFREVLSMPKPWAQHPKKDEIAKQMQLYHLSNWLVSDMDDHDGNFVWDEATGTLTAVDHGQSGKFFDSSDTLLSVQDWKVPGGAFQDPGKGLPRKMLKSWAAGDPVAIMPLTDPKFLDTIARSEAIPSEVYKDLWRPYAKGMASSGMVGKPAPYSATKADQTVEGFVTGMDERRKNLRKQVGGLYAHLAKQRAAALKTQGDPRTKAEIEVEVREDLGLDKFLQGNATPVVAVDQLALQNSELDHKEAAVGWDETNLPVSSHIPPTDYLKKMGMVGADMMAGGSDIKDGRLQFYTVGDNPFVSFHLEPDARARVQQRLEGKNAFNVPKPEAPSAAPFVPPPEPTFEGTDDSLHNAFAGVAGGSSYTDPDTGKNATKIEKYIGKWAKEMGGKPGNEYVKKAYDWAKEQSKSADPVTKAAGGHYLGQLAKIGDADGESWAFKPVADVAEADRKIEPFQITGEMKTQQDAVKADLAKEHAKAVDVAKAAWEQDKVDAQTIYVEKSQKWEDKKKAFTEKAEKDGTIIATKLGYYPTPKSVKFAAATGSKVAQRTTKWEGDYEPAFDSGEPGTHSSVSSNKTPTYDIDLTADVAAIAGGGDEKTGRLLVNYVPDKFGSSGYGGGGSAEKKQEAPGRNGEVRMQFPVGSTKAQIREMLKFTAGKLGIDLRPSTKDEQELGYLRRMAWLRKEEGYKTGTMFYDAEPDGTTQEKIAFWINKAKISTGSDPRVTASGEKNPNYQPAAVDMGGGRLGYRRFDAPSDAEIVASGKHLTHGTSSSLGPILKSGILMSSAKRTKVGLMPLGTKIGQSPDMDVKTGGSNEVYAWRSDHVGGVFTLDPRLFAYSPTWGHPSDHYGSKVDYNSGCSAPLDRGKTVQESIIVEMLSWGSTPEILLGDKVDLVSWATQIKVGVSQKLKWINEFKAAGITTMGPDNKPIEEVFV